MKAFFSIRKKKKLKPKERVRALMEAGSGYQWTLKSESDAALEYASSSRSTPGLCIFAHGSSTLAPETRLLQFNFETGDFSFDDAPENPLVFSGADLEADVLRKGVKTFLSAWLVKSGWGVPEEVAQAKCVRWTFRHTDARPPPLALGEIIFENMPANCQLNVEYLRPDTKDASCKFKLCVSFVD